MYLQIEEHEKTTLEWNKRKQMKTKKTLAISDALDSYWAFFKFHEINAFAKLALSLLVKIQKKILSHTTSL